MFSNNVTLLYCFSFCIDEEVSILMHVQRYRCVSGSYKIIAQLLSHSHKVVLFNVWKQVMQMRGFLLCTIPTYTIYCTQTTPNVLHVNHQPLTLGCDLPNSQCAAAPSQRIASSRNCSARHLRPVNTCQTEFMPFLQRPSSIHKPPEFPYQTYSQQSAKSAR